MHVASFRVLLVTVALGCGETPPVGPFPDGGEGDGGGAGTEVAPAALPVFSPCYEGWIEVPGTDGEAGICDPWPGGPSSDCGPDGVLLPGQTGCVRLGTDCPMGDGFAADLPADSPITYIRAGTTGGDGSLSRPFGAPSDVAFGRLARGSIVALSTGTYSGPFPLRPGVTLWGACVSGTSLDAPDASSGAVVRAAGDGSEVRNLTIGPAPTTGVEVDLAGNALHLSDVVISEVGGYGIVVSREGRLTAERTVVRDTQRLDAVAGGRGMEVIEGATVDMMHVAFEQNVTVGVFVFSDGTHLGISASVIRDTEPDPVVVQSGRGLVVQGASSVEASGLVIERSRDIGVFMAGAGTSASFTDVRVFQTEPNVIGDNGRGVGVQDGAALHLRRVATVEQSTAGLFLDGAGTELTAEDVLVRVVDMEPRTAMFGRGVSAQSGASLDADRVEIDAAPSGGLHLDGADTTGDFRDLTVRDTRHASLGGTDFTDLGRGVSVQSGASLTLTRSLVVDGEEVGLMANASTVYAEDLEVRGTPGVPCGPSCTHGGHAVALVRAGNMNIQHFLVHDAGICGVLLTAGSSLDLAMGEVSSCEIGVCLQADGYDVDRLTTDVRYRDNHLNLDATDLPIPDLSSPIGGV